MRKVKKQPHVFVYTGDSHNSRIIGIKWKSSETGSIGAIALQIGENNWKAYVGVAKIGTIVEKINDVSLLNDHEKVSLKNSGGNTEKADALHIAKWGSKLSKEEAQGFFPELLDYKLNYID